MPLLYPRSVIIRIRRARLHVIDVPLLRLEGKQRHFDHKPGGRLNGTFVPDGCYKGWRVRECLVSGFWYKIGFVMEGVLGLVTGMCLLAGMVLAWWLMQPWAPEGGLPAVPTAAARQT